MYLLFEQVTDLACASNGAYARERLIASSKSTRCPSKSGPSTHANFVSPPTLRRQPPHMPVPSIMIGFMLTTVFCAYGFVAMQTNFIMTNGPIAITAS